jgi:hypothetical protein
MDLGMFDNICPRLKTRALIEDKRFDIRRSDKNSEIYVIHMHRENVWTNKWMQDPRKNFLEVSYRKRGLTLCYRRGWGSFKRKRGLTLCYTCKKLGHLSKEFP